MTTIAKDTPIGSLGLGPGNHVVKIHVGEETISYQIESSEPEPGIRQRPPTGFLKRWAGTARRIEDPGDTRLSHINEKHLR